MDLSWFSESLGLGLGRFFLLWFVRFFLPNPLLSAGPEFG